GAVRNVVPEGERFARGFFIITVVFSLERDTFRDVQLKELRPGDFGAVVDDVRPSSAVPQGSCVRGAGRVIGPETDLGDDPRPGNQRPWLDRSTRQAIAELGLGGRRTTNP